MGCPRKKSKKFPKIGTRKEISKALHKAAAANAESGKVGNNKRLVQAGFWGGFAREGEGGAGEERQRARS